LAGITPHSSPFEHCARAMNNKEYYSFLRGTKGDDYEFPKETLDGGIILKVSFLTNYLVDNSLAHKNKVQEVMVQWFL
jgi:hypothetical protein